MSALGTMTHTFQLYADMGTLSSNPTNYLSGDTRLSSEMVISEQKSRLAIVRTVL